MSTKKLIPALWERKIVRFAAVGVINTLTDTLILNILVFAAGLKLVVANCVSASISIVISYFLNHIIVFKRQHQMSLTLFLKFVMVTGLSILAVQTAVIYVFEHLVTIAAVHRLTGLKPAHAHLVQVDVLKGVAVLVGMVWNFILYNYVVFKSPETSREIKEEGVVPY